MFLVSCSFFFICTYRCTKSISAGGRCGNQGSPSEPRSKIHMAHSFNDSHPANGPIIPFRIGKLRLLSFPLCLVRRLSYKPNAWISFTDSKMWCGCLVVS
ncbi:hypothetical protein BJV74DRAFT_217521 [Russula compacta]|nr:hypothetical protein BJV74DRAFT_217521 [Russula compacta]